MIVQDPKKNGNTASKVPRRPMALMQRPPMGPPTRAPRLTDEENQLFSTVVSCRELSVELLVSRMPAGEE